MAKNRNQSAAVGGKSSRKGVGKGRPVAKSRGASSKSNPAAEESAHPLSGSRRATSTQAASADILKGFKRSLLKAYLANPVKKRK